jgi:hypothetical protein
MSTSRSLEAVFGRPTPSKRLMLRRTRIVSRSTIDIVPSECKRLVRTKSGEDEHGEECPVLSRSRGQQAFCFFRGQRINVRFRLAKIVDVLHRVVGDELAPPRSRENRSQARDDHIDPAIAHGRTISGLFFPKLANQARDIAVVDIGASRVRTVDFTLECLNRFTLSPM